MSALPSEANTAWCPGFEVRPAQTRCHPERSEGVDSHLKCNSLARKTSAGDLNWRHFRGVLLYAAMQASRITSSMVSRFVFLGKSRRSRPMAFSTEPFCQGL